MTPEWRLVAVLSVLSAMGIAAFITVSTIGNPPAEQVGKVKYYLKPVKDR